MLIKTLQTFVTGHGAVAAGNIIEVPEELAVSWVTAGLAAAFHYEIPKPETASLAVPYVGSDIPIAKGRRR